MTDLRFAARQFLRAPLFTLTAIATLALGIGANTAIFSALHALTLRALPYPDADRLMAVQRKGNAASAPWAEINAWRQARTLEASAGITFRTWALQHAGQTHVILSGMFTPGLLPLLGAEPILGAAPQEKDFRRVWLSHQLWRDRFALDPAIAGRVIELNEEPYTIAGVLPPTFQFQYEDRAPDLYFPLESGYNATHVIARLRTGITPRQAEQELRALSAAAGEKTARELGLRDLRRELHGGADRPYVLLMAAVGAVLLVACLNLANLLLARFATRLREFAIRASVGASRARLLRQFLTEAALLAALGTAAALLVAVAARGLIGVEGLFEPRLDTTVLAFTAALALVVTAVLALAPAFALTRIDLHQAMRPPRAGRLRGALIAGQVAGGFALLAITALLLRSFASLTSVPPGFEPKDLLIAGVGIPEVRYNTDEKMARFYETVFEKMAAIPGVTGAAGAVTLPLVNSYGARLKLDNAQQTDTQLPLVRINMVSPAYFATLQIPLRQGRAFDGRDRLGRPRVAIVNEAFVKAFGAQAQLRLSWWNAATAKWVPWEIVGVAGDTRQLRLDQPVAPQVFLPLYQFASEGLMFAVRAKGDVSEAMRKAVHAVDPTIQSIRVRPIEQDIESTLDERKLTLRLLGAFAAVALVLCGGGLFGLTAYAVRERAKELAIRRALGAEPATVMRAALAHALRWSTAGLALGLVLAYSATRSIQAQLFGVTAMDPAAWGIALLALALAIVAGCWFPARRATQVDPAAVLRQD
jgi:predicted permease